MMSTVLVTDGDERSALAAVRSLGRAGYRVIVAASRRHSLAGASRWCQDTVLVPDLRAGRAEYAAAVSAACTSIGVDVLLPMTDASVLAMLASPPPAPTRLPMGSYAAFAALSDKEAVTTAAAAVGLRVPRQLRLASPADAATLAGQLEAPVVLKPARSVSLAAGTRHHVVHAASAADLAAVVAQLTPDAFPVLVQERIVGPGTGVFLLYWDGLVASFAHRRLREKPPSGGVSVYCESVPLDASLRDRALALIRHFDWRGVAMVEFKIDSRTGEPVLMEINGRFWGSLQLALDAGVDFPRLLVEAALGTAPVPVSGYREGVRSRWFWGDVDHLLARLLRSPARLALPPDAPSRARATLEWVASLTRGRDQVFRLADPAPAWRESVDWFRSVLGR